MLGMRKNFRAADETPERRSFSRAAVRLVRRAEYYLMPNSPSHSLNFLIMRFSRNQIIASLILLGILLIIALIRFIFYSS